MTKQHYFAIFGELDENDLGHIVWSIDTEIAIGNEDINNAVFNTQTAEWETVAANLEMDEVFYHDLLNRLALHPEDKAPANNSAGEIESEKDPILGRIVYTAIVHTRYGQTTHVASTYDGAMRSVYNSIEPMLRSLKSGAIDEDDLPPSTMAKAVEVYFDWHQGESYQIVHNYVTE